MPDIDLRLVNKGRNEPLAGLIQQGRVSAKLAEAKAGPLETDGGWSPADTASLIANIDLLDTDSAAQADESAGARLLTLSEVAARAAVKSFIRKLRNALPRVLRENPDILVSAEDFVSGPLRDSTPKLLAYLSKIRPSVVKLDTPLARFFGGVAASTVLDQVKTALETADATQEVAIQTLPAGTQKIYELKGRVLEQIEDLNRAGRSAFEGNAKEIAPFNKDILLRARKAKKEEEKNDDAGEPENDES